MRGEGRLGLRASYSNAAFIVVLIKQLFAGAGLARARMLTSIMIKRRNFALQPPLSTSTSHHFA